MLGRLAYYALACLALKLAKAVDICLRSRVDDSCVLACHSGIPYRRQRWLYNGARLQLLLLFDHPLEILL
jgi:hypothetical protein